MEFLPADHPRVAGTIAAIERELTIGGLVYRFDPSATLGCDQLPLGEFEGAFLPVTFWFAHALAKAGRTVQAEAILLLDHYLAHTGYKGQQTDEPQDPNQRYNLYEPVPGDHGAHGHFDDRARNFSP